MKVTSLMLSFFVTSSACLATDAFASSTSCQGTGAYSDVYISITSGMNSFSQHYCIGNKDDSATNERIFFSSKQPRREGAEKKENTQFYSASFRGKPYLVTRTFWRESFNVKRVSKEKLVAAYNDMRDRDFKSSYERDMAMEATMNPELVEFICDSMALGNYHAPCDLSEESKEVQAIVTGAQPALTNDELAKQLSSYISDLVNSPNQAEQITGLINKANRLRFPDVKFD